MKALLALGVLTGLDNLRATVGMGTLQFPPRRRLQLALAFGGFEAVMPIFGLLAGRSIEAVATIGIYAGAVLLFLCGVVVLLGARSPRPARLNLRSSKALWFVPLLLSFDNLLAGVGLFTLGVHSVAAALVIGCVSASFSLGGLYGGAWLARRIPLRTDLLAGPALMLAAIVVVW